MPAYFLKHHRKILCCRSVKKGNAIDIVFGNYSHLPVYSWRKEFRVRSGAIVSIKSQANGDNHQGKSPGR